MEFADLELKAEGTHAGRNVELPTIEMDWLQQAIARLKEAQAILERNAKFGVTTRRR